MSAAIPPIINSVPLLITKVELEVTINTLQTVKNLIKIFQKCSMRKKRYSIDDMILWLINSSTAYSTTYS